jgi:LAGLIDADG DNA endonuclease family
MTLKITGFNGLSLYNAWLNKLKLRNIKINFIFNKRYFHTRVRSNCRIGPHNTDVISVIFGSLLGDGNGDNRNNTGVRFRYRQSVIHKEYLFWLYRFFNQRGYCSNLGPHLYKRISNFKGVNKTYEGYEFNLFTFTSFEWIYKMFYKKGKKRIHLNLGKFLTPLALAVWISDDGCWTGYGVRIATNCFTLKEVKLLVRLLKKNYKLNSTIQKIYIKNRYSIYIKKESIPDLRKIVSPFMHESMKYKLGIN